MKNIFGLYSEMSFSVYDGDQFGQRSHVLHFTHFYERPVLCVPQKLIWQEQRICLLVSLTLKILTMFYMLLKNSTQEKSLFEIV